MNVYHSVSREQVERYLYKVTYNLLKGVVDEKSAGMSVREEDIRFIADTYKYAFVGIMLEWIRNGMREDPKGIIEKLDVLIHGSISQALEEFRTDSRAQT